MPVSYTHLDVYKRQVDSISISLNMPDAASYNEVVRPAYGEKSFDAVSYTHLSGSRALQDF